MARLIDADRLAAFPHEPTSGTEDAINEWIEEIFSTEEIIDHKEDLKKLCWKVINGFIGVIETEPTVDAAPVIHWTCETDMTSNDTANYCPDCGAKFDAGVQKYKIIKICKATDRRCKNCKRGSCVYRKEVKRWVKRKSFPKSQKEQ